MFLLLQVGFDEYYIIKQQKQNTFKMEQKHEQIKKKSQVFRHQSYIEAPNKLQYIQDLIEINLTKRKITTPFLSMNELIEIMNDLQMPLKNQLFHQLYLYSTYQKNQKPQVTKKKLQAMVNQVKHKIDTKAISQWINDKIQTSQIKLFKPIINKSQRSQSQHYTSNTHKILDKLPPIKAHSSEKLQDQLKVLIEIFQQMETQRQTSGLIPLNQNEEDELQIPSSNIPYDPDLYLLNNNLSRLRIKAEDRLARIIELAKSDKRIRVKLEEAIQKFQKQRIEANQKVGRIGAMKAYKRLIEKQKQAINKIRNLSLNQDQNLVKASHLHALLNLPVIKSSKIIY